MTRPEAIWLFACVLGFVLGFMIGYALRADKAENELIKKDLEGGNAAVNALAIANGYATADDMWADAPPDLDSPIMRLSHYDQLMGYPAAGGHLAVAESDMNSGLINANTLGQLIIQRASDLDLDIELTMKYDDEFHRFVFTWYPISEEESSDVS